MKLKVFDGFRGSSAWSFASVSQAFSEASEFVLGEEARQAGWRRASTCSLGGRSMTRSGRTRRGDILKEDVNALAAKLKSFQAEQQSPMTMMMMMMTMVTARPPCPGYCALKGDEVPGHREQSDRLFARFVELLEALETEMQREFVAG